MICTSLYHDGNFDLRKKLSSIFFVLSFLVSLSPLCSYFTGVPGNFIFLFFCFLFLLLNLHYKISINVLYGVVIIISASICMAIFWQNMKLLTLSIYCSLSLYMSKLVYDKYLAAVVSYMTTLFIIITVLAWVGFFYALSGGVNSLEIVNPDGRYGYLYLTTMTNYRVGNYIRPSGFFDEPGALSFFICITAYLRDILNRNGIITYLLLFLGMITFSVAHIIFTFLFFLLSERLSNNNKLFILLLLPLFGAMLAPFTSNIDVVERFITSRFEINESGNFSGDNRSERFLNSIELIFKYPKLILFGLDEACLLGDQSCTDKYGVFGENVLSPLIMYGFFNSIYFYFILITLVLFSCFRLDKSIGLLNLAIVMLLLQRPYAYAYGYSAIIALCLIVGVCGIRSYKNDSAKRII